MAELEWQSNGDRYAAGIYRIEPLDDGSRHNWRLTTVDESAPADHFQTLSVAFVAAAALERARIRRARVATHLAIGVMATLVAVVTAAITNDLTAFVIMMGAVWLAMRSFTAAMSEHLGDAWGWTRASGTPRKITPFDQAWAGLVGATKARVVAGMSTAEPVSSRSGREPKVRILPPE